MFGERRKEKIPTVLSEAAFLWQAATWHQWRQGWSAGQSTIGTPWPNLSLRYMDWQSVTIGENNLNVPLTFPLVPSWHWQVFIEISKLQFHLFCGPQQIIWIFFIFYFSFTCALAEPLAGWIENPLAKLAAFIIPGILFSVFVGPLRSTIVALHSWLERPLNVKKLSLVVESVDGHF